jgi:trans-aconitate methyltransferase
LGAGGGNNASFLKRHFQMTLTDPAEGMLAHSRLLNPDCEHIVGDMRTLRLGREFDRVFIHDAISYMSTVEDLRAALETAFLHCRPGGCALICPDYTAETFAPATESGGHDDGLRGLRYLEWVWDPEPGDHRYVADYIFALRDSDGAIQTAHDRHIEGLFSHEVWLDTLRAVGFHPAAETIVHEELDGQAATAFIGLRPS